MKKVISIPLHIGDLLAKTHDMDAREFGAHMRLLIAHYQAGEDGITADERKLARIAGVTMKVWKTISPEARKGFHMVPHPGGLEEQVRWVHDRCLEEITKIHEKSLINSNNALKRKRIGYANANPP